MSIVECSLPFKFFRYIKGCLFFPFIFISKDIKTNYLRRIVINHYKIHAQQLLELGILPFYAIYILEALINIVRFPNLEIALKNISFEKEANINHFNDKYLDTRPFWNWIKYYFKPNIGHLA